MRHELYGLTICVLVLCTPSVAAKDVSTLEFIDSISPPGLMQGVGNSQLKISTEREPAQRYFDQGVSLLHDFWWFEAYRSFLYASQLDADSPMPHWGMFQALQGMQNLTKKETKKAKANAIKAVKRLQENASEREQYYLQSIIALHADADKGTARHNAKLVALLNKYPDEVEARLFLWQNLDTGFEPDGSPAAEQLYGQLLLEQAIENHPDHHGLLHYWIHSQESGQHPESALDAARRLATLAPASGHIVHMPGHIHYLMGNYTEAHKQFRKAQLVDERYMTEHNIEPIFTWNYLHNFNFMMSNLAEAGRYAEAEIYAARLEQILRDSSFKKLPNFDWLLEQAIMERAYMALRLEKFAVARDLLQDTRWDEWEHSNRLQVEVAAYRAYSAGMAAVHAKQPDKATRFSRELDSVLWRAERDEVDLYQRGIALAAAALELQGVVESLRGNDDTAIATLIRATQREAELPYNEPRANIHPAAESLAAVYLKDKNWKAARAAYNTVLTQRPKAGLPLYGIARSYELEGKHGKAKQAYAEFQNAWQAADKSLPQKRHAAAWLAE